VHYRGKFEKTFLKMKIRQTELLLTFIAMRPNCFL
jgi:hypothetical protein